MSCIYILLKWIIGKKNREFWTDFIWLRIETSRGLLWTP
jgi:hypothetical protein